MSTTGDLTSDRANGLVSEWVRYYDSGDVVLAGGVIRTLQDLVGMRRALEFLVSVRPEIADQMAR
jgi:hypothetical protein